MMSGSNAKLLAAGKRLLTIFAVLWGAATLTFVAVKLIPGDPVAILIGSANSVV
ncbi:MAG: ABC transporter permease, partial [Klebsiella pneumoniae]|nr:ABC transporter permease [Klebsiella pneumoniae]